MTLQARTYGDAIRRALRNQQLTQRRLAQLAGIAESTLSEILSGKRVPPADAAERLARRLDGGHELDELYRKARAAERLAVNARPEPAVDSWAAAPALSTELRSFLRSVEQVTDELPYSMLARHRRLSTMYVRQQVSVQRDADALDEWDALDEPRLPRPRIEKEQAWRPREPVREILARHRHLLIEGDAGMGKSTLGWQQAWQLARRLLDRDQPSDLPPLLPVVVPARALAERTFGSLTEALAAAANDEVRFFTSTRLPPSAFGSPLEGLEWFVVIDALDEIPDLDSRGRLFDQLALEMARPGSPLRFLITTRPLSMGETTSLEAADVGFYELAPFDKRALVQFAEHWFNPDGRADKRLHAGLFLDEVRSGGLEDVLEVPLLAAVAAVVYEQDPGSPLPANRFGLYERYIDNLRLGRPSEQPLPGWLANHHEKLLEVLAEVHLTKVTPLLQIARRFVEALPEAPPHGMSDPELEDLCKRGGLLTGSSRQLRFIHRTFAEHLAARYRARSIPAVFDPADGECDEWLRRALHSDDLAQKILLHYLLRPEAGTRLLDLLQNGTQAQQKLADRLVEQGARVSDRQLATHLERLALRVGNGSAGATAVRALAGRVQDPPVRDFLASLARDSGREPELRIEAVRVLAGVSPEFKRSAPELYAEIVARSDTFDTRLAAARAEAQLGSGHLDRSTAMLHGMAADHDVPAKDRLGAATALLDLGSAPAEDAAELMIALAEDEAINLPLRTDAAARAAGASERLRTAAVTILSRLLGRGNPFAVRRAVAEALLRIDNGRNAQGIGTLEELAADRTTPASDRLIARAKLAMFLPSTRPQLVRDVRAFVCSEAEPLLSRVQIAQELGGLGPHLNNVVADHLEILAGQSAWPAFYRRRPAELLRDLGSAYHSRSAAIMMLLAEDRSAPNHVRISLLTEAAALDPEQRENVARSLLEILRDPTAGRTARSSSAEELATMGEAEKRSVAEYFASLIAEANVTREEVLLGASTLLRLGGPTRPAAAALLANLAGSLDDSHDRLDAAFELAGADARFRERATTVLCGIVCDPAADPSVREDAALNLLDLGPAVVARVAPMVRAFFADPTAVDYARVTPGSRLADISRSSQHSTSAADLRRLIDFGYYQWLVVDLASRLPALQPEAQRLVYDDARNPAGHSQERVSAARTLVTGNHQWGANARMTGIATLREVATDRTVVLTSRLEAASELARNGVEPAAHAAETLLGMVKDSDLPGADRRRAAVVLAAQGEAHVDPARKALADAADDPGSSAIDRILNRAWLAGPSDEERTQALAPSGLAWFEIREIAARLDGQEPIALAPVIQAISRPTIPSADRLDLGEALARRTPVRADLAVPLLTSVVSDAGADGELRVDAAASLARLGDAERRLASTHLNVIATDISGPAETRCKAAVNLASLGVEHHNTAASLFLQISEAPDIMAHELIAVSEGLSNLGPRRRPSALAMAARVAGDEQANPVDRATALFRLSRVGPTAGLDGPERCIRGMLRSVAVSSWEYRWLVEELIALGIDSREYAAEHLVAVAERDGVPAWHRLWTAALLRHCGWHHQDTAHGFLGRLARESGEWWIRAEALEYLRLAGGKWRLAGLDVLRSLISDAGAAPAERAAAAGSLARQEFREYDHCVAALVDLDGQASVAVLGALAAISPNHRGRAGKALASIMRDPRRPPTERVEAAKELAAADYSNRLRTGATLLELTDDPDPRAALAAALELDKYADRYRSARRETLTRLRDGDATPAFVTAVARAALNPGLIIEQRAAADRLDAVIDDPQTPAVERGEAYRALSDLGFVFPGRLPKPGRLS